MFMKCLSHFICCGWWAYGCTLTQLHLCRWGQNFENFGLLRVSPNNIMVSCLEDVNHPTLLLTSILHVLKVLEHLHMLWMGMWVHPYTLTPVHVGPNFGNMGVRVSPNPIIQGAMFGGCKPTHFVSQINIKCLWNVWATSYAVDRHMGAPLHSYTCAGGGKNLEKFGLRRVSPYNIMVCHVWRL